MKRLVGAIAGLAVAGAAFSVAAAGYPDKPITFVIPYSQVAARTCWSAACSLMSRRAWG
jgi:tripartite-type tricarboxylate transporter receptor subunit TctC